MAKTTGSRVRKNHPTICEDIDEQRQRRLRPQTIKTLEWLLEDLKREAMRLGRYEGWHTASEFDKRDKSAAFACIGYRRAVRQINALTNALDALDADP